MGGAISAMTGAIGRNVWPEDCTFEGANQKVNAAFNEALTHISEGIKNRTINQSNLLEYLGACRALALYQGNMNEGFFKAYIKLIPALCDDQALHNLKQDNRRLLAAALFISFDFDKAFDKSDEIKVLGQKTALTAPFSKANFSKFLKVHYIPTPFDNVGAWLNPANMEQTCERLSLEEANEFIGTGKAFSAIKLTTENANGEIKIQFKEGVVPVTLYKYNSINDSTII